MLFDVLPGLRDQLVEHGTVDRCGVGDHLAWPHLQRGQGMSEEPPAASASRRAETSTSTTATRRSGISCAPAPASRPAPPGGALPSEAAIVRSEAAGPVQDECRPMPCCLTWSATRLAMVHTWRLRSVWWEGRAARGPVAMSLLEVRQD